MPKRFGGDAVTIPAERAAHALRIAPIVHPKNRLRRVAQTILERLTRWAPRRTTYATGVRAITVAPIQTLEARTFLSASPAIHAATTRHGDTAAGDVQGYTPAQIREAYGVGGLTLGNGAVADGTGQTIAIVDPYNDPNIASDLQTFDTQFGLPAATSLMVVNASGGSALPRTDGNWSGEIATDVEWAHAIAPGAKLLLVDAQSDSTDDLMTGVNYARTVAGVSVISMSWGGSEFASQVSYDGDFTTPAGHEPITFVTAAGDNGPSSGAQWPASSPNVLSVGGTVLNTADATGAYASETAWGSSSGGISRFETEPAWQQVAQRSGWRAMPDVALVADLNTGLALYDSVPYQGTVGWQTTGGTSVGAPEWGALIALADQARAAMGQPTLDGPTQALPELYALYHAPGTAGYATYGNFFHDVVTPDAGQTRNLPTPGYDAITGLGTPKARALFAALTATPPAAVLSAAAPLPASLLSIAFVKSPALSAIAGTRGLVKLKLSNHSNQAFNDALTLTLSAGLSILPGANDLAVASDTLGSLKLKPGQSRMLALKFTYPLSASSGSYHLFATAAAGANTTAPAVAETLSAVNLGPAFVTLTPTFNGPSHVAVAPDARAVVSLVVRNLGNTAAVGTLDALLYESPTPMLASNDSLLTTTPSRHFSLRPGAALVVRIAFVAPAAPAPGGYYLVGSIQSSTGTISGVAAVGTRSKS